MMTKKRFAPKVFISSTKQDLELARDIARRLQAVGLEPMANRTVRPGEDFRKRIGQVIRSSDAVIFLVTPAALESPWLAYETGVAEGLDKHILAVVAGTGQRPLSPVLESYQTVPYDQFDEAILALAQRLRGATAYADDPGRT
jgi:nucleoside 2-deoxyribosyltransferase